MKQATVRRTILDNPKAGRKASIRYGIQDGFITPYWRKRVIQLYQSLIPSHVPIDAQIWLQTPEEIEDFIVRIQEPDCDLSSIEYVVLVETIADIYDIVHFFDLLKEKLPDYARVLYLNYNWLLAPIFRIAGRFGFTRRERRITNFYRDADLDCFTEMSGWENVKQLRRFIFPCKIPILSAVFDNLLVKLPLFNLLALITVFIARKEGGSTAEQYSVSVLVPCRNEEDNIEAAVTRIPQMGSNTEIVFINDKSTDRTEERIHFFQQAYPQKNILLVQGQGRGKGEAIREGMKFAQGDICMVLDADLTVIPEDLPQFYQAMRLRRADFIHGTRLVYPCEEDAMRFANVLGNVAFSIIFTYLMDVRTTDTLCGTKVYWRRDWQSFEGMKQLLGNSDIWGDYNLIFGASRYGLKIAQLPVRYFERLEGTTKMVKRLKNGVVMLRVCWYALWQVKFVDS